MRTRIILPFVSLLMPGIIMAQTVKQTHQLIKNVKITMPEIQNKEAIRTLYDEVLNKRKFDALSNLISVDYRAATGKNGPQAFEEPIIALIGSLPDAQWKIEQVIAENDQVMVRWKLTGTNNGPYLGFAATGR
ncbi:MAG TPA: ester cyclase, partial [Mucilaginibacter sp.]